MKVKGKFRAEIEIIYDYEESEAVRPFDEIKAATENGELAQAIEEILEEELGVSKVGKINVRQLEADLHKMG